MMIMVQKVKDAQYEKDGMHNIGDSAMPALVHFFKVAPYHPELNFVPE